MAGETTIARPARRQHFIARFYLRNFAEPLFSDNLCVYDIRKQRWERRTPEGVGWSPHLCSMIEMDGTRTDAFDQYLKLHVEDPAAPALKKLAIGGSLDNEERAAVAMFIALTAARSPQPMSTLLEGHLSGLAESDRAEIDALVRLWCQWTQTRYGPNAHREFLKPSSFGAIWVWSQSIQRCLLQWEWHLIHTTRDKPFITSDRPVLAQWDRTQNVRLVTFPVSSEVALVIISGGQFNDARDRSIEARALNLGTMDGATEFVVSRSQTFPCDDFLTAARTRAVKS
ncbi:hypothetical protein RAS2_00500 [Phycisphaerae bacterium RAS2]|nr:hypothetical protein RAS2_00500 [Phycisphaerae bacterium RAS2]